MKTDPKSDDRFNGLLAAMVDGKLQPGEREELNELLKQSESRYEAYLDYVQLHAMLRRELHATAALSLFGVQADGEPADAEEADSASIESGLGNAPHADIRPLRTLYHGMRAAVWYVRRDALISSAAAALVIGTLLCLFAILKLPSTEKAHDPPAMVPPSVVARLLRTHEAVWADLTTAGESAVVPHTPATWTAGSGARQNSPAFHVGDLVSLKEGLVEVEFAGGARAILASPAEFQFDGEKYCTLERGELWVRVERAAAVGFTVATSAAMIVDLGTEFRVEVDESRSAQVNVVKGSVEVSPRFGSSHRLTAGEALRVENSGTVSAPSNVVADSRFFMFDLLGKQPIGYWRLGETSGDTARDLGLGHNHGKYMGGAALGQKGLAPGDSDPSVRFDGVDDYLTFGSPRSLEFGGAITVVAWIQPEALPQSSAPIACQWANMVESDRFYFGLFATGQLGVSLGDGANKNLNASQTTAILEPGQTYFVAFTWQDGHIEPKLYINGRRDRLAVSGTIPSRLNVSTDASFHIGAQVFGPGVEDRFFQGVIDEVAVFNRALTPAEIEQIYRSSIYSLATSSRPDGDSPPPEEASP